MRSGSPRLAEEMLGELHAEMRACRQCLEAGFSVTPGAVFSGPASARLMIVGQAPGVTECETGRPFNGTSGQRLFEWLAEAGWDESSFRATQYMTAITKCYPGKSPNGKGDRAPTRAEQRLCASYLKQELGLVQPEIVVPVGSMAVRRLLGQVRLSDVVGDVIEGSEGRLIVPLPHPSGVNLWLNRPNNQERVAQALAHLQRLRKRLAL
ncbi:MAG: uracil-DNA glycosylase family protein [Chloroflexota bacterium]|nr:uracil-DNA glycosylase family protein [Chloroflexota bacterium]